MNTQNVCAIYLGYKGLFWQSHTHCPALLVLPFLLFGAYRGAWMSQYRTPTPVTGSRRVHVRENTDSMHCRAIRPKILRESY